MAILLNWTTGDDEPCDRDADVIDESAIYGVCPTCGSEHGAGFCPEPNEPAPCACGVIHNPNDCPTTAGHGAVL